MRVIDPEGNQLGVISKSEALQKAQELGLDLIEVAPNAKPPVARILDFKKFKYEESKKEKAAKKGEGASGLKELWLSPRIAEHDLKVRLSRAEEFLGDGYKVKLTVKFKGREMAHPEFGHQVIKKALGLLGERVLVERDAKMEGRKLSVILAKTKGVSKENAEPNGQDQIKSAVKTEQIK